MENNQEHLKIEVVAERTESGDDHQYSNDTSIINEVRKEQTPLAIIGLILALPFPILIVVLWVTLDGIKESGQVFGGGALNALLIYLFQFFVVPVLSITSVIIAFIVTMKSRLLAKKIGYVSLGVTGAGLVILGIFLNTQ